MTPIASSGPDSWNIGASIHARRQEIAEAITARQFTEDPELAAVYGEAGRQYCIRDTVLHIEHLAQALALPDPALFLEYVRWAKVLLSAHGIPESHFRHNMERLSDVLGEVLPSTSCEVATQLIATTLQRWESLPETTPSFLRSDQPLTETARAYLQHLMAGRETAARALVSEKLAEGVRPADIALRVIEPAQKEVGRLWQLRRARIADEHLCTAVSQDILAEVRARALAAEPAADAPTAVAACPETELHDMGLRTVTGLLALEGWRTIYLGAHMPAAGVVDALGAHGARVLLLSVTMTPRLWDLWEVITKVRRESALADVKILVGGRPFNASASLWRWLGADGTARDGEEALHAAHDLAMVPEAGPVTGR